LKKNIFRTKAYPNPATSKVQLNFYLPEKSPVNISLFNLNGHLIQTICNENFEAGDQTININLDAFSNGIYLIKLTSDKDSQNLKITKI